MLYLTKAKGEQMNPEQVEQIWSEVFPNSSISISKACLSNYFFFRPRLAKDRRESINNILDNDPLSYMFSIEDGKYIEQMLYFFIKPDNKYLAYSRVKLRKKSISNVTPEKLRARFLQVKEKIVEHKDNFINLQFDINEKIEEDFVLSPTDK